jgi:hypothetical protein
MVAAKVFSSSWTSQFEKLNEMFSEAQIGNSLCAIHMICIVIKLTNNFPSTLQDFRTGKHVLLIIEVPSYLPLSLISIPPSVVPS